jgi:acyl-CoA thioester hydrolase
MTARRLPERSEFRFWTEEKLRNRDTDQFGHVNNAAIASFFEAGRMEMLSGPDAAPHAEGASLAVVRLLIEFSRELFFPGRVEVGSSVTGVGNTSFNVRQALFDDAGCVASAEATCVLIDAALRTPRAIPEGLRAYLSASG